MSLDWLRLISPTVYWSANIANEAGKYSYLCVQQRKNKSTSAPYGLPPWYRWRHGRANIDSHARTTCTFLREDGGIQDEEKNECRHQNKIGLTPCPVLKYSLQSQVLLCLFPNLFFMVPFVGMMLHMSVL